MSRLLCFDTSTERLAIAVCAGDETLTYEGEGGAQASTQLLPQALALLDRAGFRLDALDAIAYGRGPGAFTGLRTACSAAQGLALGAGKPVVGVDSLMLVAEGARAASAAAGASMLWVAMDARMNEIYAGRYRRLDAVGTWLVEVAPALYGLDAFHAAWQESLAAVPATARLALVGSAPAAFGDRLQLSQARLLAPAPAADSRAQALAAVARVEWAEGHAVDAALALPLYLRNQVAQTTLERAAIKAASLQAAPASGSA